MLSSTQGRILVVVLVLTVIVSAIAIMASKQNRALAQVPPGLDNPPGPAPPPPDDMATRDMWMMRRNMMGAGAMGGGGGVAITANQSYVYVVMGGTVYQLKADTLKEVNKTNLMSAPMMPMSPGMAPGDGRALPRPTPPGAP